MKSLLYLCFFAFFAFLTGCCDDPPVPPLQPPTANAGLSQAIGTASTSVTGTSTSTNGTITNFSWTQVSGPNSATITSPNAATTSITGLIVGNYLFQFAVIDPAGLTASDTMTITVLQGDPTVVTLQPAASNSELTMVLWSTIYSDPGSTEIIAEAWTSGGPFTVRNLFGFDLSSIPAGANIISARLSLYSDPNPINGNLVNPNFGTANAFYLSRVTSPWDATTVWGNQPSLDLGSRLLMPHTNNSIEDLLDIDVTSLVGPMLTNNYGFQIQLENEVIYNSRIFCSSRHADASKHPKLVITYL